jgi:hypothetical protein
MQFLLAEQELLGQFEIRTRRDRPGDFVPAEAVVRAAGGGYFRFFGPLARHSAGSTKEDVAESGNIVWLDADAPTKLEELRVFEREGIPPSVVLASGEGYWCYWKLEYLVSTNEIERINKRLIAFAEPFLSKVDRGAWNKDRRARLPGTVHEDTGVVSYFVEEFCTWKWTDAWTLGQRLPELKADREVPVAPREIGPISDDLIRSVFNRFRWYIEEPPSEEEIHARGRTRHGIEFALVKALLLAGCSEEDVVRIADEWQLLKHMEYRRESPGNPYHYIEQTISKALDAIAEEPELPEQSASNGTAPRPKRGWHEVDRGEVLLMISEAESRGLVRNVKGWAEEIVERYGCVVETAENALGQLEQTEMIEKKRGMGVRGKGVLLTDAARTFLAQEGLQRGRLMFLPSINKTTDSPPRFTRQRFLRRPHVETGAAKTPTKKAIPSVSEQSEEGREQPEEIGDSGHSSIHSLFLAYRAEHFGFEPDHIFHGPLDATDRQVEVALKRNWIDDTYRLSFLGRQSSWLLQFVTNDTTERVLFYDQLRIGSSIYRFPPGDVTGRMVVYRSFISQRDWRVENGINDLIQRRKWKTNQGKMTPFGPKECTFGIGALMAAPGVLDTYTVVGSDDLEDTRPKIGLIAERDSTFWKGLRSCQQRENIERLTDHLFEVNRTGSGRGHKFSFTVVGEASPVEIPASSEIDLDHVFQNLVSAERLEALISGLHEEHCPWD